MYRLFTFIFSICVLLKLSSCGSTALTSSVSPKEIKSIVLFEPQSYIELIEKGNLGVYDDSTSDKAMEKLKLAAIEMKDKLKLNDIIHYETEALQQQASLEINTLVTNASKNNEIKNTVITKTLDSLLEAKGQRFGMITVTTGFIRSKKNYNRQQLKGALIGLATLGSTIPNSIKSHTNLFVMILDSKDNNISYYNRVSVSEKSATSLTSLKSLLEDVFDKYLITKPVEQF